MAPMPDVAYTAKVTLTYNDTIGDFGSRFFINFPMGSPTTADCEAMAGSVGDLWLTHLADFCPTDITLREVDVEDLTSHEANSGSDTTGWAGALTGNVCSNNAAVDIQFKIPNSYRGGHPGIHMPPGTAVLLENNREWGTSWLAEYLTAWEAYIAAVLAVTHGAFTDLVHVTLHGYRNPPPSGGVVLRYPTSYAIRQQVGSMRRRLRLPR